jgi:hypothetical protein
MNDRSFDALALHAAGRISRRASLGTLGAAGVTALAALSGVRSTAARKKGKGKKKRGSANVARQADQKCAQQKQQCVDFVKESCPVGDQECALDAILCCRIAGECDIIGFLLCIAE